MWSEITQEQERGGQPIWVIGGDLSEPTLVHWYPLRNEGTDNYSFCWATLVNPGARQRKVTPTHFHPLLVPEPPKRAEVGIEE